MTAGTRGALIDHVVEAIDAAAATHPLRVAVDGPPAAGKTTLADEVGDVLREQGRYVIRASIESFLYPRARRYRNGEFSADACYNDSFDYDGLHRVLLEPLGPGGDLGYQTAVYDKATDSAVTAPPRTAPADAVLLFDGVFLMRPELVGQWDLRILVTTEFEATLARARVRDLPLYGTSAEVERRWRSRYQPSQQFYFATVRPTDLADIVVGNDDLQHPTWEVHPKR